MKKDVLDVLVLLIFSFCAAGELEERLFAH